MEAGWSEAKGETGQGLTPDTHLQEKTEFKWKRCAFEGVLNGNVPIKCFKQ